MPKISVMAVYDNGRPTFFPFIFNIPSVISTPSVSGRSGLPPCSLFSFADNRGWVTAAFDYFKKTKNGHIAVISSIAGTKGLGVAPAYSATKRFQNTYIDALAQLARMQHLNIRFTDIRPGFVATDLLRNGKYPMLMHADKVAEYIVRALKHKKRVTVIDGRYRLLVFFWRMIPRWLWERLPIKN